jgi:hypothetical protein
MLPEFAPTGISDRDLAYEEWVDDCERNATDLHTADEEDFTAYSLSEDSYIPFDPPQAA